MLKNSPSRRTNKDLCSQKKICLQGLELELCAEDRVGLLSDITRIFRENSLSIKRAEISTEGGKVRDTFYVTDVTGNPVDDKTIDSVRGEIGQSLLRVIPNSGSPVEAEGAKTIGCIFGSFFRAKSFQDSKLIKSCS